MAKITSIYSVHPSVAFVTNWRESLKEQTGRSLGAWLTLVKASGPPGEKERIAWLKQEHRLGTNSAIWIAQRASGKEADMDSPETYLKAADKYVNSMFRGPYSPLRPLYDELLRLGLSMGEDVKACPCKTMVPHGQFHVVQRKVIAKHRTEANVVVNNENRFHMHRLLSESMNAACGSSRSSTGCVQRNRSG